LLLLLHYGIVVFSFYIHNELEDLFIILLKYVTLQS
jgi:hypothetical protein